MTVEHQPIKAAKVVIPDPDPEYDFTETIEVRWYDARDGSFPQKADFGWWELRGSNSGEGELIVHKRHIDAWIELLQWCKENSGPPA